MAKKEQEETTSDDNDQVTCTKTSQELKEEVSQKYACVYRTGAVRKTLPHWNRPNSYTRCGPTLAALREGVKAELDNMEKRGVIWKVEEPTDWVNSMAIVEKPDGICASVWIQDIWIKVLKGNTFSYPLLKISRHAWQMQRVFHQVRCKWRLLADEWMMIIFIEDASFT